MYGLIIKKKWLDLIMSGQKTLEIRGSRTSHAGEEIALLESGSQKIRGFCTIKEVTALDKGKWEPMICDWETNDFKEYRKSVDYEVIGNIFDNPELLEV